MRTKTPLLSLLLAATLSLWTACAIDAPTDPAPPDTSHLPAEDFLTIAAGKADGMYFDANHILEDWAFADAQMMSEADIQTFFESSPYGTRSFLADHVIEGQTVAQLVQEAAVDADINPLVLLTRMQVEQALIFFEDPPSSARLNKAMGCGCPDDAGCNISESGLARQITCAADLLRSYLDDLEGGGQTVAGWGVGYNRQSMDGTWVTPANRATAALYTYTPWVLPWEGGNWLFSNVYAKYVQHALEGMDNHHWIGGSCSGDSDCPYEEGICLTEAPGGLCTRPCDGLCPDARLHPAATTFCVDLGTGEAAVGDATSTGHCVSRCEPNALGAHEGCRAGFQCAPAARFGDTTSTEDVCLPGTE